MTRFLLTALAAASLAVPAAAAPPDLDDVAKPCGGDGYEYGAYVYVPGPERPIPACIVQR